MNRWPADVAGLRTEWSAMKDRWQETATRAQSLGDAACLERVSDEWSFVETLRHLVFVTDAWIGRTILRQEKPYHREALPPTFLPDLSFLGIDTSAEVSLQDALRLRGEAQAAVDGVLADVDDEGLLRVCDANPAPGFPPDTAQSVLRCLRVVLNEESAHHDFAIRDLATLEGRS